MTERLDEGDVLAQRSLSIDPTDNDGRVRWKLARLAGVMTPELLGLFAAFTKPPGIRQEPEPLSPAPRPAVEDGYLERAGSVDLIRRKVRALNPLPGTSILLGDRRVAVDRFALLGERGAPAILETDTAVDVAIGSDAIRLFKKLH